MQTGTQMTKLKGKKKGLVRFFYLDEHKSCIRWRPSKKHDKAKSKRPALSHKDIFITRGRICFKFEIQSKFVKHWTCEDFWFEQK